MQPKLQETYYSYSSPISLLEELFFQLEWNYERLVENELVAEIQGRWCSYQLFALWRPDLECFMFSALEQMEEIINNAVLECDRLYPALQFVLWGDKNPEEALMAAMLDTYGEA